MKIQDFQDNVTCGGFDNIFANIYKPQDIESQKSRYMSAVEKFTALYPNRNDIHVYSAPGRTEIGGNHTDHQHGCVIAGAVDLDVIGVAAFHNENIIRIKSEEYDEFAVSLDDLDVHIGEKGSSEIVRGIAARFKDLGVEISGFDMYTTSNVLGGSGISSSAAFETLIATAIDSYYNNNQIGAVEIAKIGQYAENFYFGKKSGLMDQMVCSVGGFVFLDFQNIQNPSIQKIDFDLNNLCGTKILLNSMVEHHIDKIVFSSTAATYGEPENIPILETDRTQPTNPYGETKLAMEKMFYWTSKAHGLRYISLRYFNACGADKSGKIGEAYNLESHLIPLILQVPNGKRESISIYGTDYDTPDGTCIRDYIHVTDLAQAHILAVKYLKNGNESNIFNLGNGVGYSVKEVIDKARKVTGHPIPAIETPKRAGDPARLVASSEKARKILGWNPVHDSLEEIISDAWNWHKNHPDGF